jgi:hypothetical protein
MSHLHLRQVQVLRGGLRHDGVEIPKTLPDTARQGTPVLAYGARECAPHCLPEGRVAVQVSNLGLNGENSKMRLIR